MWIIFPVEKQKESAVGETTDRNQKKKIGMSNKSNSLLNWFVLECLVKMPFINQYYI